MDARLRSHLQAGLVCGIEPADRALRLGILKRKLDLLGPQLGRRRARGPRRGDGVPRRSLHRQRARAGRRSEHAGGARWRERLASARRSTRPQAILRPAPARRREADHRRRDPEGDRRALRHAAGRPALRAAQPRHRAAAPGGHVAGKTADHPLAARHRPPLRRARSHHGAARRAPHRSASRRGRAAGARPGGSGPQTGRGSRPLPRARFSANLPPPSGRGRDGGAGGDRGRDFGRLHAAFHRTGGAAEGPGTRAERRRAAQHHPDPLQRAAVGRARDASLSRPPISTWRSSTRPPAQVEAPGQITAPAHTLYEIVRKLPEGAEVELRYTGDDPRLQVAAGRSQLQPAGAAGRRLPGDVVGRALGSRFVDRHQRPDPADRQDPLRHLHRGDPLLSERPLPAHGGRGRARASCAPWPPTATAWRWPRCRRPKGSAGAPGVIVPRKTVAGGPAPAGRRRRERRGAGLGRRRCASTSAARR